MSEASGGEADAAEIYDEKLGRAADGGGRCRRGGPSLSPPSQLLLLRLLQQRRVGWVQGVLFFETVGRLRCVVGNDGASRPCDGGIDRDAAVASATAADWGGKSARGEVDGDNDEGGLDVQVEERSEAVRHHHLQLRLQLRPEVPQLVRRGKLSRRGV